MVLLCDDIFSYCVWPELMRLEFTELFKSRASLCGADCDGIYGMPPGPSHFWAGTPKSRFRLSKRERDKKREREVFYLGCGAGFMVLDSFIVCLHNSFTCKKTLDESF